VIVYEFHWKKKKIKKTIDMELIYFFAFWGLLSLGILIYALVVKHREKRTMQSKGIGQ
jgi:hypothetical protein